MGIHNKESTPPPTIGKIGPYTVFVTPTSTPVQSPSVQVQQSPVQAPPVQSPPVQFHEPAGLNSDGSVMGFFRKAVVKVQNAHSSLDEHVAHWFGLNQSKYQWALDDYYETKGGDQVEAKATKDISRKAQSV